VSTTVWLKPHTAAAAVAAVAAAVAVGGVVRICITVIHCLLLLDLFKVVSDLVCCPQNPWPRNKVDFTYIIIYIGTVPCKKLFTTFVQAAPDPK
jgi:hypothetical protein